MKRLLFFPALIGCVFTAHADPNFSTTLDSQSGTILISTTPAAPTKIFSQGPYGITNTFIINDTAFRLYYSTNSVSVSTTPATGIPGATGAAPYARPGDLLDLDGPVASYNGQLYAVLAATTTVGGTAATPQSVVRVRIR